MQKLFGVIGLSAILCTLGGCDMDVEDRGELPEVDVDAKGGRLPDVDVEVPHVDVSTEREEVTVPDIDVGTEEAEVTVPNIDVDVPEE